MAKFPSRDEILEALQDNNILAFLHLVREGETSQNESAYREIYGGALVETLDAHPRIAVMSKWGWTSAAGAYQFMAAIPGKVRIDTWDTLERVYGHLDFSPHTQDMMAVALIGRRGAIQAIREGRIHEALNLCRLEWASLPGSQYGQPTQRLDRALEVYKAAGGRIADAPTTPGVVVAPLAKAQGEIKPMGIFAALLPSILQALPQLISVFSSPTDSDVAKRNQGAAVVVADTLIKATNAVNLQDAVDKLGTDPAALDAAHAAVNALIPQLIETGDGGIGSARKAAFASDQLPFWRNPAFVISLAILPLIYMVAVAILFGVGGQTWSDDIKTLFVTAIVSGSLGGIQGFFLGSSLGSQKKDALMGAK